MNLLVFDFGGGTFDVSVLACDGSEVKVLATEGVAELGGRDVNECLKRKVLDEFKAKLKKEPSPLEDPQLFLDIEYRVERAKISLGTVKELPIVVGYKGDNYIATVTQKQFYKDIEPLAEKAITAMDKAVAAAGLKMEQIGRLIMVGGTSKIGHIQDMVADHTGLAPRVDIDPQNAVVYGAALASVTELINQGKTPSWRGHAIPSPDIFVRDITAHGVGCCVIDRQGRGKRLCNAGIIKKNTPIPCQKTERFYLEHDDQAEARIEILQGDEDADRDDCLLIGELTLSNLPSETKRTARVQVEYTIDADGMVTAVAKDLVSGQQQTVSVDYKKGVKASSKPAAA